MMMKKTKIWENQVYDAVVSLGMGNDLRRSIVDAWNWAAVINFLGADLLIGSPFCDLRRGESVVEGVLGVFIEHDDDDDDDEWGDRGFEGSSSGTSR